MACSKLVNSDQSMAFQLFKIQNIDQSFINLFEKKWYSTNVNFADRQHDSHLATIRVHQKNISSTKKNLIMFVYQKALIRKFHTSFFTTK